MTGGTLNINGVTTTEAVTLDTNGVLQGTGTSGLSGTLFPANATDTITATTAGTDVLTVSGKITGSGGFSKTGAVSDHQRREHERLHRRDGGDGGQADGERCQCPGSTAAERTTRR